MSYILMENCRLCQTNPGIQKYRFNPTLTERIQDFLQIQISDDISSYLPDSVCEHCSSKINDFYTFRENVKMIDKQLRNFISAENQYNKISHSQKEFKCDNCFISFEDFDTYIAHRKVCEQAKSCLSEPSLHLTEIEIKMWNCPKCEGSFENEEALKIHLTSHGNSNRLQCNVCFQIFSNEVNLTSHKLSLHSELFCSNCGNFFESSEVRKKHVCYGLGMDFNTYKSCTECNVCGKVLNDKVNLKAHRLSAHLELFCGSCDSLFTSLQMKKMHVCSYMDETDQCPDFANSTSQEVQAVLTNEEKLTNQENKKEKKGLRPFLCVTCGKSFTTKNSLMCHEKIHSTVKGYQCKICNIGFSVRSNLRAHEKKYHEGITFSCSKCEKTFVTKVSLDRHEKIHTGVKEFKCQSCSSAFYTNKELLRHQKYHQGVKQHKCNECFKSFFERHHLIIHLRSHTGERPYICKIPGCQKSFTDSQKLKIHESSKHITIK